MSSKRHTFSYAITLEGDWNVAQCLDIDVASQGKSIAEALTNLREALELHFEDPIATLAPQVGHIEIEVGAA
jgi:predicted RNase H-like HicB family nuclease